MKTIIEPFRIKSVEPLRHMPAGKLAVQDLEQRGLALGGVFRPEFVQDLFNEGRSPLALEKFVRAGLVAQLARVAVLGPGQFQRDQAARGPTPGGLLAGPLLEEEVLETAQQKGAEPAFLRPQALQPGPLQQVGEKTLHGVFGLRRRLAPAPGKSVERTPIGLAQAGQGTPGAGTVGVAGLDDD